MSRQHSKDQQQAHGALSPKTVEHISVVAPCYNEAKGLDMYLQRVTSVLDPLPLTYELVFVNDGSRDTTLQKLREIASGRSDTIVVNLTRNFGKEIALTAGLAHASGDAIAILDADLQDPPEVLVEMLEVYREGYDTVYGQRRVRHGETAIKKATARWFYRLARDLGPVQLPENVGDFRIMSRRVVQAVLQLSESHRFMKGLFAWVGYPSKAVLYDRDPRFAGETSWNYWKLLNFSIEGITSFTIVPLRITTIVGFITAVLSFLAGMVYLAKTVFLGEVIQGFPTLILTILLLGGTQLLGLGIIGEYLGRVFNETKQRPLYLIESVNRPPTHQPGSTSPVSSQEERAEASGDKTHMPC